MHIVLVIIVRAAQWESLLALRERLVSYVQRVYRSDVREIGVVCAEGLSINALPSSY